MSRCSALSGSAGYHGSQSSYGMPAACPTERFFPDPVAPPGKHRCAHLEPPTKDSVGRDQLCANIVMGTQFQSLVPALRPIGS